MFIGTNVFYLCFVLIWSKKPRSKGQTEIKKGLMHHKTPKPSFFSLPYFSFIVPTYIPLCVCVCVWQSVSTLTVMLISFCWTCSVVANLHVSFCSVSHSFVCPDKQASPQTEEASNRNESTFVTRVAPRNTHTHIYSGMWQGLKPPSVHLFFPSAFFYRLRKTKSPPALHNMAQTRAGELNCVVEADRVKQMKGGVGAPKGKNSDQNCRHLCPTGALRTAGSIPLMFVCFFSYPPARSILSDEAPQRHYDQILVVIRECSTSLPAPWNRFLVHRLCVMFDMNPPTHTHPHSINKCIDVIIYKLCTVSSGQQPEVGASGKLFVYLFVCFAKRGRFYTFSLKPNDLIWWRDWHGVSVSECVVMPSLVGRCHFAPEFRTKDSCQHCTEVRWSIHPLCVIIWCIICVCVAWCV